VCPVREECGRYAEEMGSSGIWAGVEQRPRHVGMIVSSGAA
jgi:hypothetical protein